MERGFGPGWIGARLTIPVALWIAFNWIPGGAQDLETAWEDFVARDNRLQSALEVEQGWVQRQQNLQADISSLQENQSWYNGWITEWRLASKGDRQVVLADSLRSLRERIATLNSERDQAFRKFREVYQRLLLVGDTLSVSEKERALALGFWAVGPQGGAVDLPDYSIILDSPYENKGIERLVFQDLQSVLEGKLALIDSLLRERDLEITLLRRLNEFHQDLSVQQRTDLDLGSTEFREGMTNAPDREAADEATGYTSLAVRNKGQRSEPTLESTLDQDRDFSAELSFPLGATTSSHRELQRLRLKQQQYRELLQRIQSRLEDR